MERKRKLLTQYSMASAGPDKLEEDSCSDSDSGASETEEESGSDVDPEEGASTSSSVQCQGEPCRYYNSGHCRDGNKCRYLHFCKYALRGNCRYGSRCYLKHPRDEGSSSEGSNRSGDRQTKLDDGRYYQWQVDDGKGWKDIANDHVMEAQYSLPLTKGMTIYNTPYGAVKIDFKKMRVYGKRLKVRRLDDGKTVWLWYCSFHRNWIQYGEKVSKLSPCPAHSSDIEDKFQSNPTSSFTFSMGLDTFEIRFREMQQVSATRKRKVVRRPQYRPPQAGARASQVRSAFQGLSLGSKAPAQTPQWQFEGNSGKWHVFKHRNSTQNECSLSSDDIESKYQQNPNGTIVFTVSGQHYKLDFGALIQTKQSTKRSRKIRRVLL